MKLEHCPWPIVKISDIVSGLEAGVSVNSNKTEAGTNEKGILKTSSVTSGFFRPCENKIILAEEIGRAKINPKADRIIISRMNTPQPGVNFCVKWLSYILASDQYRKYLSSVSTGTSNSMKNISKNDILNTRIPLPNYEEQKEISRILTLFDNRIKQVDTLVQKKKTYHHLLMNQLLTGKRRFSEFSEQWSVFKLQDIIEPITRAIKKPLKPYDAIGIRSHCKGTFPKRVGEPEKVVMEELYVANKNDLIVNITFAWEGAIAIVPEEHDNYLVSHRFPTYTAKTDYLITDYLKYLVMQPYFIHMLGVISPGGAGRNRVLNKKDFLKLEVEIPGLKEQFRIAYLLKNIDIEINLLEKQLNAYKEQKKGLMQQLLTGKTRVKVTHVASRYKNGVIPDEAIA
jgi:type I restriction enzyme S subunit